MKRKLLLFTLIFALAASVLGLAACSFRRTVTLDWGIDGTPDDTEQVTKGETFDLPAAIENEGYIFDGWSRTRNGSVITDSSITVDQDLTLYAVWSVDGDSQGGGTTGDNDPTGGGTTGGESTGGNEPSGGETTGGESTGGSTSGGSGEQSTYYQGDKSHLSLQINDVCPTCGMKVFAKANNAVLMLNKIIECYYAEYYGESVGDEFDEYYTMVNYAYIAAEVKTICDDAFDGCSRLHEITIPECVTEIYRYAFYGCTSLTSVVFQNKIYWQVTNVSGFVNVDDAATAAQYLCNGTRYSYYYWQRKD